MRQSARGGPAAAGGAGHRAAGGGQSGPRAGALRAPAGKARARASSRWFGAAQGTCAAAERAPPHLGSDRRAERACASARGPAGPARPSLRLARPPPERGPGPAARPRTHLGALPLRLRRARHAAAAAAAAGRAPAPRSPRRGPLPGLLAGRAAPRRAASPRSPGERWPGAALPPSPRGAGAGRWQTCAPLPPPCRRSCPLQGTDGVAPAAPSSRPADAAFTVPFVCPATRPRDSRVTAPNSFGSASGPSLRTRQPRAPAALAPFRSPLRGAAERRRRQPRVALPPPRRGVRWEREGAGKRGLTRTAVPLHSELPVPSGRLGGIY